MKKYLLFMAFLGVVLSACKKKDTVTYVPLDPAFKSAFNFLPGSYWIYRDSISGEIDSFFVRSNVDGYSSPQANNTITSVYEFIYINITEYNILSSKNDSVGWELVLNGTTISAYYLESKIYTGAIEYIPLIHYPFQTPLTVSSGLSYYEVDTATLIGINTTYQINGQTFTNVAEVNQCAYIDSNENGGLPNAYSYNDWFYICPDIGLVKIVLNHPQDSLYRVWELQRWVIAK